MPCCILNNYTREIIRHLFAYQDKQLLDLIIYWKIHNFRNVDLVFRYFQHPEIDNTNKYEIIVGKYLYSILCYEK